MNWGQERYCTSKSKQLRGGRIYGDGLGDLPAAPRTATLAWAGGVVEKRLACERDNRIMFALMDCIVYGISVMN